MYMESIIFFFFVQAVAFANAVKGFDNERANARQAKVVAREIKVAVADVKSNAAHRRKRRRANDSQSDPDEGDEDSSNEEHIEPNEGAESDGSASGGEEEDDMRYLSHQKRQEIKQRGRKASLKVRTQCRFRSKRYLFKS
jgi:hypothetical protein